MKISHHKMPQIKYTTQLHHRCERANDWKPGFNPRAVHARFYIQCDIGTCCRVTIL